MKLTLVRHGETEENRNRIVQGQNPGRLSELGIQQSKEVATKLSQGQFDTIYSSDLQRCKDTALQIHEYHQSTPLIFTPDLRELHFGVFQGKPSASIAWETVKGSFLKRKSPEGESLLELGQRIAIFLNKVYDKHQDENILLVAHGGPMRVIKALFEHVPLEGLFKSNIPNCDVWEFTMTKPLDTDYIEKALS